MSDEREFDAFDWHEVIDRTSVFTDNFMRFIEDHKLIQSRKDLKATAEKISDQLADFYQQLNDLDIKENWETEDE